jgi:hypothetical protein
MVSFPEYQSLKKRFYFKKIDLYWKFEFTNKHPPGRKIYQKCLLEKLLICNSNERLHFH